MVSIHFYIHVHAGCHAHRVRLQVVASRYSTDVGSLFFACALGSTEFAELVEPLLEVDTVAFV